MKLIFILSLLYSLNAYSNLQIKPAEEFLVTSTQVCSYSMYGHLGRDLEKILEAFESTYDDGGFFYNTTSRERVEKIKSPVRIVESVKQIGQENYVLCLEFISL